LEDLLDEAHEVPNLICAKKKKKKTFTFGFFPLLMAMTEDDQRNLR